jgi:hypothetical protein
MHAEKAYAYELIGEVHRVRRRTRARASVMWFPLLLFGALSLVSALVVVRYGGRALGPYWMVAGPAGGIATAIASWRRGSRLGVSVPGAPYAAAAAFILVGASLAGWAGDALGKHLISAAGPSLVVSMGYLLFARLERSPALTGVAAGLAVLTVGVLATGIGPESMAAILAVIHGAVFVATGLILLGHRRESSST